MIGFCVLQVEDEENDVFFLQRAFQAAAIQHPIHVVRDGQEAIDYLSGNGKFADRVRHPLPCLILLDLKLPGVSGLEVLRWLRARPVLQHVPVIVFSSSEQRNDIDRAYRLGANAFVVKPAGVAERNELARLIKGFWLRFNQLPAASGRPEPEAGAWPDSALRQDGTGR